MGDNRLPKTWRRPDLPVAYRSSMRGTGARLTAVLTAITLLILVFPSVANPGSMPFARSIASGLNILASLAFLALPLSVTMWVGGIVVEEVRRSAFEGFLRDQGIDPQTYTTSSSDGS